MRGRANITSRVMRLALVQLDDLEANELVQGLANLDAAIAHSLNESGKGKKTFSHLGLS